MIDHHKNDVVLFTHTNHEYEAQLDVLDEWDGVMIRITNNHNPKEFHQTFLSMEHIKKLTDVLTKFSN